VELKIDSMDAGTTPKVAKLSVGKHSLQFSKEGFNTGTFPVDIGADDASGGASATSWVRQHTTR
jgi:hypothetical protein